MSVVAECLSHVSLGGRTVDVHAYLERFLFTGHQMRQPVRGLSGGERARVALAKLLSRGANLLILDEPTNDLDVATLGALEELLLDFDIKKLLKIIEREEGINDKAVIPETLDPARCVEIMFILDLTDQFFEKILDGHQPAELPVFIDDKGHMEVTLLHLAQQCRCFL